ncbi:MAG: MFS transporter [Anaerolineae bacterium]|jgi:DHA1 family tetracycline resistance protein-like MFS transporter
MDRKRLFPILLIVFTNILGAGVILPILPLYAEGQFGGTILQVTLLSTSFFAAQFLAAPWLGRLSDRIGRRPVLIVSQMGTVLAFLLFIFAGPLGKGIDGWGLALPMSGGMIMLYLARTLDGITGGNITTAQAYITDVTPEEQRAQGLGLVQAAFGAGFIFGPAFGGVLSNLGPVAPFVGATIITTGTLLLTVFTLKESLPPEDRAGNQGEAAPRPAIPLAELLRFGPLRVILAIGFFASLAFAAVPATFALYADRVLFSDLAEPGRAQLYIGLMLTFNGLMQVATQLALLKPLVSRLGERKLLLLGAGALLGAAIGVATAGSAIVVTLLFAPFAFGRGVSEPSLQSLTTRFGDRRTRGQLLGIYQSARSLALIFGPVWAGYVFEEIGPRAVFWVTGGLILVALALSALLLTLSLPPLRSRAQPEAASSD